MSRGKKKAKQEITWKEIKRQKVLLIWSAFFVIYGFIFYYLPLGGWIMAFQNYKPKDGMLHSKWIGLDKFKFLFSDASFIRVIRNTLAMGTINLVTSFLMAIIFAILLNEVKNVLGKKMVQTISYLPHFLSWIIVTGILHDALSSTGIVNEVLQKLGIVSSQINFFAHESYFWPIVAFSNLWKETGWNAIIYLAAITAIDPSLYEAASIDGAGKWTQFFKITVPLITPVIFYNLITQLAQAFQEFNGPFIITSGGPRGSTTLVSLLIYNSAFKDYEMGMASAMAWVLFIILVIFTSIAFISQKFWVFYGDE